MQTKFKLVLLIGMLAFNLKISAAEFSAQPILGITTEIDDNKRLLVDDSFVETTVGLRTQAEVKFLMLSEDTSVYITPIIGVNHYSEDIGLNTETININFDLNHLITERHQLGLSSNYSIEPVTVQSTILDPVSLSAAGLSFEEIEQERINFAPSYTYFFSDRFSLGGNFSYTDIQYDTITNNFIDYEYFYYGLNGAYSLSETDTLSTVVYRTEFLPVTASKSINNAFQITYAKDFSETLRASLGLGLTFGESETTFQTLSGPITVENSATGELISLSLEKDFEKTKFSAVFSRRVTPTAQGNERVNDDLDLNLSHEFSESLSSSLGIRILENDNGATQVNNFPGTEFMSLTASVNYKLSRNWIVTSGYTYREVEDIGFDNPRDSNNAFVTIRYIADKIIFN